MKKSTALIICVIIITLGVALGAGLALAMQVVVVGSIESSAAVAGLWPWAAAFVGLMTYGCLASTSLGQKGGLPVPNDSRRL